MRPTDATSSRYTDLRIGRSRGGSQSGDTDQLPRGAVMSVKAVFYVAAVTKQANGAGIVKAQPLAKGPYASYSKWTPSGSLEFTCLNDAATAWFEERIGKDVTLTLSDPTEAD